MHRCSDPLCNKVISTGRPFTRVDGKVYCSEDCRKSWEMANIALLGAADPFRNSPFARSYRLTDDECDCETCVIPPPEPSTIEVS